MKITQSTKLKEIKLVVNALSFLLLQFFTIGCIQVKYSINHSERIIDQIFYHNEVGQFPKTVDRENWIQLLSLIDRNNLSIAVKPQGENEFSIHERNLSSVGIVYKNGIMETIIFTPVTNEFRYGKDKFILQEEENEKLNILFQKISKNGDLNYYSNFVEKETNQIILKLYNCEVTKNPDNTSSIQFNDKIKKRELLIYVNRFLSYVGVAKYRVPAKTGFLKHYYEFGIFLIAKLKHFNNNCSNAKIKVDFDPQNRAEVINLVNEELKKMENIWRPR